MSAFDISNRLTDRASVGGAEEIEILAADIKNRISDIAQPIGNGKRFVLLNGVDTHGLNEALAALSVGEPFGVGRPGTLDKLGTRWSVIVFGADLLGSATGHVQPEQAPGVVHKRDLLAVGRPDGRIVKTSAAELDFLHFALTVLAPQVQLVLAAFIGEVGNLFAVGRPDGVALMYCR